VPRYWLGSKQNHTCVCEERSLHNEWLLCCLHCAARFDHFLQTLAARLDYDIPAHKAQQDSKQALQDFLEWDQKPPLLYDSLVAGGITSLLDLCMVSDEMLARAMHGSAPGSSSKDAQRLREDLAVWQQVSLLPEPWRRDRDVSRYIGKICPALLVCVEQQTEQHQAVLDFSKLPQKVKRGEGKVGVRALVTSLLDDRCRYLKNDVVALNLGSCKLTNGDLVQLAVSLEDCSHSLQELDLSNALQESCSAASGAMQGPLQQLLEGCRRLSRLNLSNNKKVSDQDIAGLLEWVKGNPKQLKHLDISETGMGEKSLPVLTVLLGSQGVALQQLLVNDCRSVKSDAAVQLLAAAVGCGSLRRLNMSQSNLVGYRAAAAKRIQQLMARQSMCSVQLLNLSNSSLGDEGAKSLASALPYMMCLQELYLAQCNIGPTGIKALSSGLAGSEKLATLTFPPLSHASSNSSSRPLSTHSSSISLPLISPRAKTAAAPPPSAAVRASGITANSSRTPAAPLAANSVRKTAAARTATSPFKLIRRPKGSSPPPLPSPMSFEALAVGPQQQSLSQSLRVLDLSGNAMGGGVEELLRNLPSLVQLEELNLSDCRLTGDQVAKVRLGDCGLDRAWGHTAELWWWPVKSTQLAAFATCSLQPLAWVVVLFSHITWWLIVHVSFLKQTVDWIVSSIQLCLQCFC
jgi:Ran GTPase-activating protein (RanGAP) involved in mRNA processing and transport